jgi:hypothetical protein
MKLMAGAVAPGIFWLIGWGGRLLIGAAGQANLKRRKSRDNAVDMLAKISNWPPWWDDSWKPTVRASAVYIEQMQGWRAVDRDGSGGRDTVEDAISVAMPGGGWSRA